MLTRRRLLAAGTATLGALARPVHARRAATTARALILGGGFAGATAARYLARWAPDVDITLITSAAPYWTCPFSNTALAGLRSVDALEVDYSALEADARIHLVRGHIRSLDPVTRRATLTDGRSFGADRIVVAPGIEVHGGAIEGWSERATQKFPHAWEAGPATRALFDRLQAVPDGGLVLISAPENPYRCPPGPYERASLMAWWLATHRPRARLLIADAKDRFTKDALFKAEWTKRYPNLQWLGRSDGGAVRAIDPDRGTVHGDFDDWSPDLACIVPPQRAALLARRADLDGGRDWCPVAGPAFESTRYAGVHVIGDAAIANPMPKSAFAANSQGKTVAAALAAIFSGGTPPAPLLMNTCYSYVAPDAAISIAASYTVREDRIVTIAGSAGVSTANASEDVRTQEGAHAAAWYASVVTDAFG